MRAITDLTWRREPDGVVVATVAADAFCQAMVRSLVGALLPVGDGRRPRAVAGVVAAPPRPGR